MIGHKYTRGEFARAFLPKVGASTSDNNMLVLMAWMQAEGDAGRYNPLNTTQHMPGSTRFNFADVQNYLTFGGLTGGVRATAKTLNFGARTGQHGYKPIRHALAVNAKPSIALAAIEASAWGTGGLALRVYEDTPDATLLELRHHRLAQ